MTSDDLRSSSSSDEPSSTSSRSFHEATGDVTHILSLIEFGDPSAAEELLPLGIRINCINPPRTNTEMRRRNFPGEDPATLLAPEVVAREILKYCSAPGSGYVIDLKVGIND